MARHRCSSHALLFSPFGARGIFLGCPADAGLSHLGDPENVKPMSRRSCCNQEASLVPQGSSLPMRVVGRGSVTPLGLVTREDCENILDHSLPPGPTSYHLEINVLCSASGALLAAVRNTVTHWASWNHQSPGMRAGLLVAHVAGAC